MKLSKNLKIFKNQDGLEFLEIKNSQAEARIALQGAHVDWWKPNTIKDDVLWLSSNARYEEGRSIRGGVPICWPWFGEHPTDNSFCLHGFARVIPWELIESSDLKNDATKVVLRMMPTETVRRQLTYNFELILTIVIGESLNLNLKTTNLSASPFTISEGFHTYFYVSDINNVNVTGLENALFTDKNKNFKKGIENQTISFKSPIDRVYLNSSNDCYLEDKKLNRIINIKKSNSNSLVIWNPGEAKANEMSDMGENEEWRRMICIETANTLENSVVIYPKLSHNISTEYSVQEY